MKHKLFLLFFLILILSINYIGGKEKFKIRMNFTKEINLLSLKFYDLKQTGGNYSCLDFINNYEINYKEDLIKYTYKKHIILKTIDMEIPMHKNIAATFLEKILVDLRLLAREKQNTLYLFCDSENNIIGLSVYKKNLIPNFLFQVK